MDYLVTKEGRTPSMYDAQEFAQESLGIVNWSYNFSFSQEREGLVMSTNFPEHTEDYLNSFGNLRFKPFTNK